MMYRTVGVVLLQRNPSNSGLAMSLSFIRRRNSSKEKLYSFHVPEMDHKTVLQFGVWTLAEEKVEILAAGYGD